MRLLPDSMELPYLREHILSGNPELLDLYFSQLLQSLRQQFVDVASVVNQHTQEFTPVAVGSGTAGTGTYDVQIGRVIDFGYFSWVYIHLQWDDANHTGTSNLTITGLPRTGYSLTNFTQILPYYDAESGSETSGVAIIAANSKTISALRDAAGNQLTMTGDKDIIIQGMLRKDET